MSCYLLPSVPVSRFSTRKMAWVKRKSWERLQQVPVLYLTTQERDCRSSKVPRWLCQHERREAVGCDDVTFTDADCVTVCRYARSFPSSPEPFLRHIRHIEAF